MFVFGSNLRGIHGAGAALHARHEHGAAYYWGVGHHGMSYALPTKDERIKTLPLWRIYQHVAEFLEYAKKNPQFTFYVTRVGCGLAGYKDAQIAPYFKHAPDNCILPEEWIRWTRTNRSANSAENSAGSRTSGPHQ